jgi:hypothetical protein
MAPAGPGGPSRLPSFGPKPQAPQSPIGGQDVQGSDGPTASDPVGTAPGGAKGARGTAGPGHDAVSDGQVTVPPAAAEQRLPIFDSLESDWFRRSGKTLTTTTRTQGPQGAAAASAAAEASWTSPADEGWRAAQAVATPAAGETTRAGLPRRVPRANLVPGSVGGGGPGSQEPEHQAPARSADAARSRMASFQRGVREGRAAAPQIDPPKIEES